MAAVLVPAYGGTGKQRGSAEPQRFPMSAPLAPRTATTDANGVRETVTADDLFYWPPGHNVKVDADAEIVMFSPQREHSHVIDHMIAKLPR